MQLKMIKYESNTQRERFIKQGGASLWWTYTLSSVLHSAGCVIKPKGNSSSFVGFERIYLEPLKVNFKNIDSMFSQAPNNPQNSVHLHNLKAGDALGKEWPSCSSWPTQSQAEFPGWLVSVSWLPLPGGGSHPVQTAADTDSGCFTWTLAEKLIHPLIVSVRAVEPPLLLLHPQLQPSHLWGWCLKQKKKSIKIDFIHENDGIMYFTCLLIAFSV